MELEWIIDMVTAALNPIYGCDFWNCVDEALADEAVCSNHLRLTLNGELDECPLCDLLKFSGDELCGDCDTRSNYDDFMGVDPDLFRSARYPVEASDDWW